MAENIRLILIDDHTLFREGLGRLLQAESGLELKGSFSSIQEAASEIKRGAADILLLDFDLGDQRGLQILTLVREWRYPGRILMVTAGMQESEIKAAFDNGVSGIFLKHSPPADLVMAINRVWKGEVWLDPRAMRAVTLVAPARVTAGPSPVNDRERQVLEGVFEGLTNKEIASRMKISVSYVKALLQQLFEKTRVRTRAQLVRVALERKIDGTWLE